MPDETCIFHPAQKAVAVCEICGHSFCPVCIVNVGGRTLCRGCAETPPSDDSSGGLEDLDRLLKRAPTAEDDPLGLLGGPAVKSASPEAPPIAAPVPPPQTDPVVSPPPTPASLPPVPPTFRSPVPTAASAGSEAVPLRPMSSFGIGQPKDAPGPVVLWWKVEKALKPLSRAVRAPAPAVAGALVAILLAAIAAPFLLLSGGGSLQILDTVTPVHLVKVQVSQVGELDITTYLEMETQLREIGFSPLVQVTLPQAPSPNFVAAFVKENAGVYAELLKLPGVLAPKVAFITVFGNGVWCSTNGFAGKDVKDVYLDSSHFPEDPPDRLYVKHMQKVERLKKEGWTVSRMGESRYVSALTDHFRWFLAKRKIPGYRAAFDQWH